MLHGLEGELLRNQVMLLLAYDGALRREELVRLEVGDFDFAYRQVRVQAEHAKNRRERVVGYGKTTSRFLEAYLRQRRTLSTARGQLFLSESHRNASSPLALVTWSKVVQKLAERAGLPRFTHPYTTSSQADAYGPCEHGIASDRYLCRTQVLKHDDALHPFKWR
jgi:site-specific recombinase XerD